MNRLKLSRFLIIFLLILLVGVLGYLILNTYQEDYLTTGQDVIINHLKKEKGLAAFNSEKDFKNYIAKAEATKTNNYGGGAGSFAIEERATSDVSLGAPMATNGSAKSMDSSVQAPAPERVSGTNVQVLNIDEPDIVKTNGQDIYFSREGYYRGLVEPMMEIDSAPMEKRIAPSMPIAPLPQNEIQIIKAFPAAELAKIGKIEKNGNLILKDNVLAVFQYNNVYGYDVTVPSTSKQIWQAELKDNSEIIASRLYNDRIYLIARKYINEFRPCPLKPLSINGKEIEIACNNIYHPAAYIPADVTYTVAALNLKTGEIEKNITFIGSASETVVYMSANAIYVTYNYPGDFVKFIYQFLKENENLIPAELLTRINKLQGYDISASAKMSELSDIINKMFSSLDNDERLKIQNELNNKMDAYYKNHRRDLEKTGIVRIATSDLKIEASGEVPGKPLNQFSLDEYNNNLRIAVTIGESWWGLGLGGRMETANDVYVLDEKLKIKGEVKDLGLQEKIYSVRFAEDKGYLVTFRQTDPFYVLDLADPAAPQMKGELKIPGFSSYLHPISKDKILGIGQENGQVKVSLFDVSQPVNPVELAKYNLDDYWTEVSNNHHAFLLDAKHEIFFLPGGKGGYVFSYKENKLELVKAISEIQAKRAVYINDSLYIIAQDKITVLDENTWEKTGELEL